MKKILILFITILATLQLSAQDMHFSQYYASPFQTNPAYTGFFDGDYRVGFNYKNQWSFANGFNTFGAYADAGILRHSRNSWIGIGLNFLGDQAGDGNLTTTKMGGTFAYHLSPLQSEKLLVSAGIGAWYVQKSFDPNNLYFDSQWTGTNFDTAIPTGENFNTDNFNYTSLNVGLTATYVLDESFDIYGSAAMFNINEPDESFFADSDNIRVMRHIYELGANFYVGMGSVIEPGVYMSLDKGAMEVVAGANFAIGFGNYSYADDGTKIIFGGWYRVNDAFAPLVGVQMMNMRLLMNYDINASKLSPGSNGNGGFEMSFVYIGDTGKRRRLQCPKF